MIYYNLPVQESFLNSSVSRRTEDDKGLCEKSMHFKDIRIFHVLKSLHLKCLLSFLFLRVKSDTIIFVFIITE